ncbi:SNF2-related protein [Beauveria brongniartii RCEF 3172]|uniref:SNF2-related protein n=1 Tax=Beauveria brongniartii RCEF 3172 TaxID=1081107 RepID=A0A167HP60_9HYPO|nr:SNF2-related protein [Beauveria brongniartii RCEF 3172]
MALPSLEDPFLWDLDRVCRELCCDGAEWTNDVSAFESLLRENLMDGETLLTYELIFSRKELTECLGVTAARHRTRFFRKIMNLQKQSPRFRQEKRAIDNDGVQETSPPPQTATVPIASPPQPTPTITPPIIAQTNAVEIAHSKPLDEQLLTRRRLVPTFVTDIQPGTVMPRMPGFEELEPEPFQRTYAASVASSMEDLPTAYLGQKAVAAESIVPLDVNYDSDSGPDTFCSVKVSSQPRGKTRAIYSMVKKFLLKNDRKVTKLQSGTKTVASSSDGRDVVDFDDLASLDEDTLREMADEEDENRQASSSLLSSERVETIVNQEIAKFQSRWEEKKLDKLERKAHRLWIQASKHGQLRKQAFETWRQAGHYRNRLSALTRDLRVMQWKTEEELRFSVQIVEQTVEDKLHQEWLTTLFSLRSAPPKPSPISTPRTSQRKRSSIHNDELSSSSEEESLENFIVADEPDFAHASSVPSPRDPLSPALLDINTHGHAHSPPSSTNMPAHSQQDSVIDLTMTSDVEVEGAEESFVPRPLNPFTQEGLAEAGGRAPKVWAKQNDRFRLAISMLWKMGFERREAVFQTLTGSIISDIWLDLINKAHDRLHENSHGVIDAASDLTRIYWSFVRCKYLTEQKCLKFSQKDLDKFEDSEKLFPPFCGFLADIQDGFPQRNQIAHLGEDFDNELGELDELPDDSGSKSAITKKSKKKEIVLDKSGVELRERAARDMKEQEKRRNELRAAMRYTNTYDSASACSPRFIINESKANDQGFIYVHPEISSRIKEHQIEGVRFLWNHIVRDSGERQGCLLAHTMGLGKTMQTITFLVALRESALSDDPTVRDQIPQDLRDWKVLVLCPAGLVENWKDEFLIWAPKHLMEAIFTVEAVHTPLQRVGNAKEWVARGGILIIGYNMFKSGFRKGDESTVTIDRILVENATVVIADEAHSLKNPKAKITQVASDLKTSTRIALTGSPLANNVEEYYAMINWVAPNFLGPLQEFRDMYATPIHQGLYHDSTPNEKRQAIKLLQVLKTTAAPKVHRATMKSSLKDELPPKEEFVISVPPTEMQRKLYDLYMQATHNSGDKVEQATLFGVLNHLALICAHPAVYRKHVIELKRKGEIGIDVARFPMDTIPQIMNMTSDPGLDRVKLSYKVELLNKILDQSSRMGDKVLVFSQSIPTLDYLAKLFGGQKRRFCRLDGSTQIAKRQDMVKRFNKGSEEVYLISTNAGGVGLNIFGANRVVIFDFKYNPVSDQQAIGRAYRIGQTKPVFVYRFVVAGSFEDDLQNKAVFKMQLASRVVDQKNPVSWSKRMSNLMHLIQDVDATNSRFNFKGKDAILDHLLDHDESRAILSIMSSDAFEEEDETATLTAEERQEADSMVERHRLRMTDPDKYVRMTEAERVVSNQRPTSHIASSKPNKDWFPERPDHAFEPTSHYGYSAPPAATVSSGPMPILGANTYYGNSGSSQVMTPNPSILRSNTAPAFSEVLRNEARDQFQEKLAFELRALESRHNFQFGADSKSVSITNEIEAERLGQNKGVAADTLRWNSLTGKLGNKKNLLAIASGQVSAKFMGESPENEMQSRFRNLEDMSDEFFLSNIQTGGKPKDPEVRQADQEHTVQLHNEESKD